MQKMTKEHIGLCLFLKIPFFIVLTKVDLAPQNKYDETVSELKKLLKHKLLNKFPIEVKESTTENVNFCLILVNSENGRTHAIRQHVPNFPHLLHH